ncbi:hypothetical protein HK102_013857, partial [Quaeritorhiza haematococci]
MSTTETAEPASSSSSASFASEFFAEDLPRRKPKPLCVRNSSSNAKNSGSIRDLLRRNWEEKQAKLTSDEYESEEMQALCKEIEGLKQESECIGKVRKERLFDEEPTEEELAIIQQRVAIHQKLCEAHGRIQFLKKAARIRAVFEYLTEEEIKEILQEVDGNDDTAILNLTQPNTLTRIRQVIALKYNTTVTTTIQMTDEQKAAYEKMLQKRGRIVKRTTSEEAKKRVIKYSRLRLDDALQQLENEKDPEKLFSGWSDARIRAYKMIDSKPNSYYYRFNAPGEKQRNGAWTKEERALFMKRLDEMGADGQWGIFSMKIPGRVGYQCSNFYRHLLKSGEVIDPNYIIDAKGGLRYLFGKKDGGEGVIRTHSKHGEGGVKKRKRKGRGAGSDYGDEDDEDDEVKPTTTIKRKRRRSVKANNSDDDGDDDDEGEYTSRGKWSSSTRRTRSSAPNGEGQSSAPLPENPLPGFIDPISLEEVIKPAMSPYGHVMGYENWVRCLSREERKNICPFTKQPMTKRELVILTFENIEEYR